jgi:capsular exopolysaccharide synthesis family protein
MYRSFGNPVSKSTPVEAADHVIPARPAAVTADPFGGRPERGKVPAAALRMDEHLVSLRSPESFEADQYRVLRHFLQGAREGGRLQVIAVSSPAAGEGKTTTAVNLAGTLAQSPGTRVLLVDTDLRRPSVATSLGIAASAGPGLAGAVLDPRLDLAAVVRPTPFRLSVVPAGVAPGNAYQILESPRVGRLLEEARRSYDYVVVDTPPLLVVPDCRLLFHCVDGFIVVVAARRTPRKLLAEAIGVMDPDKLLGIVFNGDDRPLAGYYKGYYSGYYHDRGQPAGGRRWLSWWPRRQRGRQRPWR